MPAQLPGALAVPLTVSFGLSLFPWGKYALYPFRILTTWAHECCHALAALSVGGEVTRITLASDTSGLAHFRLPPGKLRHAFVASAGYLGSSLVGCLLFFASIAYHGHSRALLQSLGIVMILSLMAWVRGLFGMLMVALLGSAMILGSRSISAHATSVTLTFLAIQIGLNALFDIRELFGLGSRSRSDAQTLQSLFYLPAWFWASIWLAMSLALTALTLSRTGKWI